MDLVRAEPAVGDLDGGLVASYPSLARRLALILGDPTDAEDLAQAAVTRAVEHRNRFSGGDGRP